MLFLGEKRRRRDREAGLVFHWRGVRKHYLGKFFALVITAACFGFAAYALRIEGLERPLVSQSTGTLILLNEDDPNCRRLMLQIEESSPFPLRWDPAYDEATKERIASMAESLVREPWEYQPALKKFLPSSQPSEGLPSIDNPADGLVKDLMPSWHQDFEESDDVYSGDLYVRGVVSARGELGERLIYKEWALPVNLVLEDWYGQSFRFLLGVDEGGVVRSCVLLSGGSMGMVRATDRQKELAFWLRAQRFKPAKEAGMVFGELYLQIEATRE